NRTTTINRATTVFAKVQSLYANAGISINLRELYVWTTADPYSGINSGQRLTEFMQLRPVINADVGLYLDISSYGGVAAAVGGLCASNNYAYAGVNHSYQNVPTYSWTVEVIAHELGHLLGSPHTHACVWNGNNTAIDNCGSAAMPGSEGSSCKTTPLTLPTAAVKGTIMSYCHLFIPGVGNIGINFANGFGEQPAQRMKNYILSSPC